MEPDSLNFLTLINKVQSHSVGVLGVYCFQDTQWCTWQVDDTLMKYVLVRQVQAGFTTKKSTLASVLNINSQILPPIHWNNASQFFGIPHCIGQFPFFQHHLDSTTQWINNINTLAFFKKLICLNTMLFMLHFLHDLSLSYWYVSIDPWDVEIVGPWAPFLKLSNLLIGWSNSMLFCYFNMKKKYRLIQTITK